MGEGEGGARGRVGVWVRVWGVGVWGEGGGKGRVRVGWG